MSKTNPLVSITIPTMNSERTIKKTLESIKQQNYPNYEIIIIDKSSSDNTLKIAKKFNCKIFNDEKKLLGARYLGVTKSSGEFVILLDSDQILAKNSIKNTLKLIKKNDWDMVFFEEDSYKPKTLAEKLISLDRKLTHKIKIINPSESVLLPRFFKRNLILNGFEKINPDLFNYITLQDHAIIYHECYKISKKIGYVPKAVYHIELKTFRELFLHYFYWGIKSADGINKLPKEYTNMFQNKLNKRAKSVGISFESILVLPIIFIKGGGYYLGYFYTKLKRK